MPRRPLTLPSWPNMALTVKLDEDLSPIVGRPLQAAGYKVTSVLRQGWSGLPDRDL